MRKKIGITVVTVAIILVVAVGVKLATTKSITCSASSEMVYVESVASLTGQSFDVGIVNNFSGVIEPQKTESIKLDSSKKVKEIFVSVGDVVDTTTPLFSYDTDDLALSISQAKLELDRINNDISSYVAQIAQLEKEKQSAPESEKLSYTTQIQSVQINQKKEEYNKTVKELEIQKLNDSLNNTIVYSTMSGVVKSVNENGGYDNQTGEELPFMTILATGDYMVKGTINEQNIYDINEGDAVIVQSRVDEDKVWSGVIQSIDRENPLENNNYYSSDTSVISTKYNFYVTLDNATELMLGQHVYIRKDISNQINTTDGVWLYDWYIVFEEEGAYVWVANSNGVIEKREVILGDYNDMMGQYEILDGITLEDYIAFPEEWLEDGVQVEYMEDIDLSSNKGDCCYDFRA